uniref:Uncharacterized protein n=1 Tax=Triticum urartu TaxID=4572 RepID=A0A8R7Q8F3_TRIUA
MLACPVQVGSGLGGCCGSFGLSVPEVTGTALGWFHRAALTVRFQRWKVNRPLHHGLVLVRSPSITDHHLF